MIFDLGGISHFAKENQFPVDWSESENAMLLNSCYQPMLWDIYWRLDPCDFVMGKVEREKARSVRRRYPGPGWQPCSTIRLPICSTARPSCGIF
jgi:hypothetical protein